MIRDRDLGRLRVVLILASIGVLIRLLYFTEHLSSPFFGVAILDEAFYDSVARTLLAGESVGAIDPGFRPLLYPAFLAAAYRIGGAWDVVAAVAAQHLMGIGTALLVAWIALRLSRSRGAGLMAGLLYLLAGPPLFFEGERLITTLFTFLLVALLAVLVWAERRPEAPGRWVVAGLLGALAVVARPNALVVLPVLLGVGIVRLVRHREDEDSRVLGPLVWAPLALGLGVLGLSWAQAPFFGAFHLPGGAGGVNFYLGNERGADGMIPRQDRSVVVGEAYRDSVEVFARREYARDTGRKAGTATPGEISRYWLHRGIEEIAADPRGWLELMGRKAWYLVSNEEIPNNKSYRFVLEEESRVLRWMPVRWWILLALAPLGVRALWRRGDRPGLAWVGTLLGAYGASLLLFFVSSRFRIPLWPGMAVLAGVGALDLWSAFRRGSSRWLPRLGVLTLVSLISLGGWVRAPVPGGFARDHLFRSMAAQEKGDLSLALEDARRSVELLPGDPSAWIQLGRVEQALDHGEDALEHYRRAAALEPSNPRPYNNSGVILEEMGRSGEAYRLYLRALEALPEYGPALVNAALLELRAGRTDLAGKHLRAAREAGYRSPSATVAEAVLFRRRGREEAATARLRELRSSRPELVEALVEELHRPLDPEHLRR